MHSEDKNTFDALMKQAEFLALRQSNRQSYQWKISFALWAGLGFALNATYKTTHPGTPWTIAWVVGGTFIIILQCWWLGALYARNRHDGERALIFRDKAEECLITADYKPVIDSRRKKARRWDGSFVKNYAHGVELSITIAIIFLGICASLGKIQF